jgi:hypothetical protein
MDWKDCQWIGNINMPSIINQYSKCPVFENEQYQIATYNNNDKTYNVDFRLLFNKSDFIKDAEIYKTHGFIYNNLYYCNVCYLLHGRRNFFKDNNIKYLDSYIVGEYPSLIMSADAIRNFLESFFGTLKDLPCAKKLEVPCKSCRKNVYEDEAMCWWCGLESPGKP